MKKKRNSVNEGKAKQTQGCYYFCIACTSAECRTKKKRPTVHKKQRELRHDASSHVVESFGCRVVMHSFFHRRASRYRSSDPAGQAEEGQAAVLLGLLAEDEVGDVVKDIPTVIRRLSLQCHLQE
jgi:hypothetical protein